MNPIRLFTFLGTFLLLLSGLSANAQCAVNISQGDTAYVACGDTTFLRASHNGGFALNNNFNNGTPGPGWQTTQGVMFNNPCGPHPNGTTYLWMGPATPAPRSLTTVSLDVSCGGQVCFDLRFAIQSQPSPCEGPDLPTEGVYFQYSINNGVNWTDINYFQPNPGGQPGVITTWTNYCFTIPGPAQTANTLFRWIQTATSAAQFDHWGMDEVTIQNNCGEYSMLWSTGDTADSIYVGPIISDTSFWVRVSSNTDTCWDTIDVFAEMPKAEPITSEDSVCIGAVVQLDTMNNYNVISGDSYSLSWLPTLGLTDPFIHNPLATINTPTDYVLEITHSQYPSCTSKDTVSIAIDNDLVFASVTVVDENCGLAQGGISDGSIEVVPSGGGGSYVYNFGYGFSGSNQFQNGTSGIYNVTIWDQTTNCLADSAITIGLVPGLNVDNLNINDVDCYAACNGTVRAEISGAIGDTIEFSWAGTGQSGFGLDSISGVCGDDYTLIVIDSLCVYTKPFNVYQPDELVVDFTLSKDLICFNESSVVHANVSGGVEPYTYNWLDGTPAAGVRVESPNVPTTYSIIVEDANGCVTLQQDLLLDVYPPIVTEVFNDTVCPWVETTLEVSAVGGTGNYNYQWSGNLSSTPFLTVSDTFDNQFLVTVSDGCVTDIVDTLHLEIHPLPDPRFKMSDDVVCVRENINFDYNPGEIVESAVWDFGNSAFDTTIINTVDFYYSQSGTYFATLNIVTVDNCELSWTRKVEVYDRPVAEFFWSPDEIDIADNTLILDNHSNYATDYKWTFPNGITAEENPEWNLNMPTGVYPITLTASNPGCADEIVKSIEVLPRSIVWVPNSFTPNNDGVNDKFQPVLDAVDATTYRLRIYDRWGGLVFETKDVGASWDGGEHQDGTYVWQVNVTSTWGETVNQSGSVHLIR